MNQKWEEWLARACQEVDAIARARQEAAIARARQEAADARASQEAAAACNPPGRASQNDNYDDSYDE
jgi:hypothetical protein